MMVGAVIDGFPNAGVGVAERSHSGLVRLLVPIFNLDFFEV